MEECILHGRCMEAQSPQCGQSTTPRRLLECCLPPPVATRPTMLPVSPLSLMRKVLRYTAVISAARACRVRGVWLGAACSWAACVSLLRLPHHAMPSSDPLAPCW